MVLFTSITAGIGNSIVTESSDKNYADFKKFTFIICFILCICCNCFIGLYQPFMKLWVGQNLMLDFSFVILFCVLFYCLELAMVWATIKDAAGIWHSDRFRPLIGALVNLCLNLILVHFVGLYGIILSTVISYIFISMPWLVYNLFSLVYQKPLLPYIKNIVEYIVVTILTCGCSYFICTKLCIGGLAEIVVKLIVCIVIPITLQCLIFVNSIEFKESKKLLFRVLRLRES